MSDKTAWAEDELEQVGVPVSEIRRAFDDNVAELRAEHQRAQGKIKVVDSYGNSSEIDSPAKGAAFVLPEAKLKAHIDAHFTQAVIDALVEDAKRDLFESIIAEHR